MNRITWRSLGGFFWAVFLITLPVTSFPFFPGIVGGSASVRPLAVYPMILLIILIVLPRLLNKPLPATFLPFMAFIVVALASAAFALTQNTGELRDVSPLARAVRGLAALGIGAAFYLSVSLVPETWQDMRSSLRWLYAGFGIALLWGSIQIVTVIKYVPAFFVYLNQVQRWISSRKLIPKRVSGLTFEPKWFAEQLVFLLIPWLLASVLTNSTIFRWRWRALTVEFLLLIWAGIVLIFTYSRTGIFIFLLFILVGFLAVRWRSGRRLLESRDGKTLRWRFQIRQVMSVVVVLIVIAGVLYAAGTQNNYFARLWTFFTSEESGSTDYFEYIAFKQRFAYAVTAFRVYEAYPLLGVGLGNYAFYFDRMLPDEPWNRQPDILRQITHVEGRDKLITPKNLYMKILSETGLFGLITFLAFVVALAGCAISLWLAVDECERFFGLAGLLGLLAFFFIGFSFDSLAVPNMWVVFGFITAASRIGFFSRPVQNHCMEVE